VSLRCALYFFASFFLNMPKRPPPPPPPAFFTRPARGSFMVIGADFLISLEEPPARRVGSTPGCQMSYVDRPGRQIS
jgi:hypothetical protein